MTLQQFISSTQKMVIHCKNEKEYTALCVALHNAGKTWCSGQKYLDSTGIVTEHFDCNHTGVSNRGTHSSIEWYRHNVSCNSIIPFKDLEDWNETPIYIGEATELNGNLSTILPIRIGSKFTYYDNTHTCKRIIISETEVVIVDENKRRYKLNAVTVVS